MHLEQNQKNQFHKLAMVSVMEKHQSVTLYVS